MIAFLLQSALGPHPILLAAGYAVALLAVHISGFVTHHFMHCRRKE